MLHAAIHPLTPGSPAYALAKVAAVGGLFALRLLFVRRDRKVDQPEVEEEPATATPKPHPVSRRKARRGRKRR